MAADRTPKLTRASEHFARSFREHVPEFLDRR
jgi:hypothetical protein